MRIKAWQLKLSVYNLWSEEQIRKLVASTWLKSNLKPNRKSKILQTRPILQSGSHSIRMIIAGIGNICNYPKFIHITCIQSITKQIELGIMLIPKRVPKNKRKSCNCSEYSIIKMISFCRIPRRPISISKKNYPRKTSKKTKQSRSSIKNLASTMRAPPKGYCSAIQFYPVLKYKKLCLKEKKYQSISRTAIIQGWSNKYSVNALSLSLLMIRKMQILYGLVFVTINPPNIPPSSSRSNYQH